MKKIWIVFIIFVISLLFLGLSVKKNNIEFLGRALYDILANYVEEPNPSEVVDDGIRGMAKESNSAFIEAKKEEYLGRYKLKLPGIEGVYIQNSLFVKWVFKGTSAHKKGVRPGDLIVEVDDFPLRLASSKEVLWRLYGEEGSYIRLRGLRKMKIMDFKIIRDFPSKNFRWEKDRLIIYRLFRNSLNKIKKSVNRKGKFILDLRYFIDGDWKSALSLASFLTKGVKVNINYRKAEKTIVTQGGFKGKFVIITDGSCEGACSILASSLKAGNHPILSPEKLSHGCALFPFSFEEGKILLIPAFGIKINGQDPCRGEIEVVKTKNDQLLKEAKLRLERRI